MATLNSGLLDTVIDFNIKGTQLLYNVYVFIFYNTKNKFVLLGFFNMWPISGCKCICGLFLPSGGYPAFLLPG